MDAQESWRVSVDLSTHSKMGSEPMLFGLQIQYETIQIINYEKLGSGVYQTKRTSLAYRKQ